MPQQRLLSEYYLLCQEKYMKLALFFFQANVQQSPVKAAVLALETNDVNAHLAFMVLSATG